MSRMSPKYLPQINMSIDEMLKKLVENDCDYNLIQLNSDELKPSQQFTLSDDVYNTINNETHPIWVDIDLNIIDGHHKWVKTLHDNTPVVVVKLNINFKDACRLLNKLQDIHEYEEARQMEEVVAQDAINIVDNDKDAGFSDEEFLSSLEEDNSVVQEENPSLNKKTLIAYRKEPIKENSVVGNFFMLKPQDGFGKYEIQFDNLLDVGKLGITYKDGQVPVEILAKIWFPNVNFEKISGQYDISSVNLMNKAVANQAMKMGFDGILYNDTLVQGLK